MCIKARERERERKRGKITTNCEVLHLKWFGTLIYVMREVTSNRIITP